MPRVARCQVIDPALIQVMHCVQRCVRQAFLCGTDPLTGKSYEHRREWIRQRMEFLASVFAIDCLTYSVMGNHLHVVLRSRPDIVASWSDEEVARRWLRLSNGSRKRRRDSLEPTQNEIETLIRQPDKLHVCRRRLSDVSTWMSRLAEYVARKSNAEDERAGRFWEGRYKCQLLLDEAALLACAAYVDLNPIRAALAETPEQSDFTGAKDRIDDLRQQRPRSQGASRGVSRRLEGLHPTRSGWLSPVEIDERRDATGPDPETNGRRASRKGFLSISLRDYLQLLDWTGRQLKAGKRGAIPNHLAPILQRIGLDATGWCDLVRRFGKIFKRAAGTPEDLAAEARRRKQAWLQAPGNPLTSSA